MKPLSWTFLNLTIPISLINLPMYFLRNDPTQDGAWKGCVKKAPCVRRVPSALWQPPPRRRACRTTSLLPQTWPQGMFHSKLFVDFHYIARRRVAETSSLHQVPRLHCYNVQLGSTIFINRLYTIEQSSYIKNLWETTVSIIQHININ